MFSMRLIVLRITWLT
ncbi:hypothetical protein LINPERPRIM_LOCUS2789 [Linum perenne]